jgi:hypothetical protein
MSQLATNRPLWPSLAALLVLGAIMLLVKLGAIGVWEPWESSQIAIAQEYLQAAPLTDDPQGPTSASWAVPTYQGRPVATSLLHTLLVHAALPDASSQISAVIGALERSSRLPAALITLAFSLLSALWLSRLANARAGVIASIALVTLPGVYLGAHSLAMPLLAVATTSLPIMAASLSLTAPSARERRLWSLATGAALALAFLDQRLLGLAIPLYTLATFGLVQHVAITPAPALPRRDLAISAAIASAPLLWLATHMIGGWDKGVDAIGAPHNLQLLSLLILVSPLAAITLLARHSAVGRLLLSRDGALLLAIPAATVALVGFTYGAHLPTLTRGGQIVGEIPVLAFMLKHDTFHKGLTAEHLHFDLWLRQIGFATFPWAALIPLGLGWAARAAHIGALPEADDAQRDQAALARLLLVWSVVALVCVAAGSAWGHFFYPAYLPLVASVSLMLTDTRFWQTARRQPVLIYGMGVVACCIILTVGKDLERYPSRLLELPLGMINDLGLPKDFAWKPGIKVLKYAMLLLLITYFFGLISWGILTLRGLTQPRAKLRAVFFPPEQGPSPAVIRASEKEAARAEQTPLGALARLMEEPAGFSLLITCAFALWAAIALHLWIPSASLHLSQRAIFETYLTASAGQQPLYRYQTPGQADSLYLRDVPAIASPADLLQRFQAPERLFAVVPRDKLAQVNSEVRQALKKNVPVLDARSGRLVLITNQLKPGEEDKSFIASSIVEDLSEIQYPKTYNNQDNKPVNATFDGKLEFLGYSLNHKAKPGEEMPTYTWGDKLTVTLYFRVLQRVFTNEQIFMHIDTRGNRIHGDHFPMGGLFPTNTWVPGDVIKDVHTMEIDAATNAGEYYINFGFFMGSRRLPVEPRSAHDGQNRLMAGKLRVGKK